MVQAYLSAIERENVRLQKQAENDTAAESYRIEPDLTLSTLLRIPDAFQVQQVADDPAEIWAQVQPVLAEALTQFVQMRQTEASV